MTPGNSPNPDFDDRRCAGGLADFECGGLKRICRSCAWPDLKRRPAFARGVVEHVGRFHFFTKGLRTLSSGKAEKSRSADQSSLTP